MGSGISGLTLSRAAEDSVQAGHPRREHVRHRIRGAAPGLLRGRVAARSTWRWRSASRSSRTRASRAWSSTNPPNDGTAGQHDRRRRCSRCSRPPTSRSTESTRTRARTCSRASPGRTTQRRAQSQGAVPEGSVDGDDQELAQDRRPARHLGLLRRLRRLGGRDRGPRRGRAQVLQESDLHQGAVVRRRPGRRPARRRTTTSPPSPRSSPPRATPTRRPASPTRASRSAWPRCTTASRRPSWC